MPAAATSIRPVRGRLVTKFAQMNHEGRLFIMHPLSGSGADNVIRVLPRLEHNASHLWFEILSPEPPFQRAENAPLHSILFAFEVTHPRLWEFYTIANLADILPLVASPRDALAAT